MTGGEGGVVTLDLFMILVAIGMAFIGSFMGVKIKDRQDKKNKAQEQEFYERNYMLIFLRSIDKGIRNIGGEISIKYTEGFDKEMEELKDNPMFNYHK